MPAGRKNGLRRIALIAAAAMVVAGLFAIAYIHANSVASCLNQSLGSRNPIVARGDAAQKAFAHAQSTMANAQAAWATAQKADANALQKVLSQRTGSNAQVQAFGGFLVEHAAYNKAAAVYYAASVSFSVAAVTQAETIDAIQKDRAAHPLGGC